MPSLDDRVGESSSEINAEAWLPFLLYLLSPDTLYIYHIQWDISGELVARLQPHSKFFISEQNKNMENFQDDNIKSTTDNQTAQISVYWEEPL